MRPSTVRPTPSRRPIVAWGAALLAVVFLGACSESPTEPVPDTPLAASEAGGGVITQVFTGGTDTDTWDPIVAPGGCTIQPAVPLDDPRWVNPHKASLANGAAFQGKVSHIFTGDWINAWGPANGWPAFEQKAYRHIDGRFDGSANNWTRYSMPVSGTGDFVLYLAADNCSWIYVSEADGSNPQLVGVQLDAPWLTDITYPVTLDGDHLLQFLVLDTGGQAGGMFRLETNTDVVFTDTDEDGLADVAETNIHGTDPDNPDTDGDGISDGDEVANGTDPLTVDDTSAPSITVTVSGTLNGDWYTDDVEVTWTITDPESPFTVVDGCEASSVTEDTQGVTFSCTAESAGGSATESVTIQRDATTPEISFSGALSYTVDETVAVLCSASDATSGIADSHCPGASGEAYTFDVGTHTLDADAEDEAGNTATASTSFTVSVDPGSLCTLVKRWVSNRGVANSLCKQLENGAYRAFANHVRSQSGKRFLDADKADILLELARAL